MFIALLNCCIRDHVAIDVVGESAVGDDLMFDVANCVTVGTVDIFDDGVGVGATCCSLCWCPHCTIVVYVFSGLGCVPCPMFHTFRAGCSCRLQAVRYQPLVFRPHFFHTQDPRCQDPRYCCDCK